ncbi:hypothetical protein BP6252_04778 [Coleophoma cylindrospora]|uniref:C2 NT-type domain-containing protein n=1 Tax=Coleophoma cylindrospora TaxID=1849047 RepID=A0A3D8S1W2_9HELO|nr:hypothetical protein BP6252_04778 [Coleophoma cylindrospora]
MVSFVIVSKARRPKFDLNLRILDLNNVPLVSGTSYVKWHLPSSTAAEHRGRTDKAPIKEHKVSWDYVRSIPVRLTIDKNNNLQETLIHFEVVQDYSSGVRGEKITLGYITLNLAEYVEESEALGENDEGITRRYLMQESKINSTLKIGIAMRQVDGERNFVAPPLKTAPVFGGIAGIMAGEQGDQDDLGHMPSMNKSRDISELQDMYRTSLAASWAACSAELPADECIEDIFNGGDGWKDTKESVPRESVLAHEDTITQDDLHPHRRHRHHHGHHGRHRTPSGGSKASTATVTDKSMRRGHKHSRSDDKIPVPDLHREPSSEDSQRGRTGFKHVPEVDEFDVRDDLVAWRLPGYVS